MVSESAQVLQGDLVKLLFEALFWFPGDYSYAEGDLIRYDLFGGFDGLNPR